MLTVEASGNRSKIDRTLLEDLFRSFHSIKGLSGMVGLHQAEQVAHQLEHYLRNLRNDQTTLTAEGVDVIIANTNLLEQILRAHRSHSPIPDPDLYAEELSKVIEGSTPDQISNGNGVVYPANGLKPDESARLAIAIKNGAKAWRFEFTPNAVRAE